MHQSLINQIREKHTQAFPNSCVSFTVGPLSKSTMYVSFYLGQNKDEMINGIIQNDPLRCRVAITIGANGIELEPTLSVGGLKPTEQHMAQSSEKIRTRKVTVASEEIAVAKVAEYFEKVKSTVRALDVAARFLPGLPYSIAEKV
jgi:hypothetical protein